MSRRRLAENAQITCLRAAREPAVTSLREQAWHTNAARTIEQGEEALKQSHSIDHSLSEVSYLILIIHYAFEHCI